MYAVNRATTLLQTADWIEELEIKAVDESGNLTESGREFLTLKTDPWATQGPMTPDQRDGAELMFQSELDNVARWILNLKANIKSLDEQRDYILQRKKATIATLEDVKGLVKQTLARLNRRKGGQAFTVSLRRTAGQVELVDIEAVPDVFKHVRMKIEWSEITDEQKAVVKELMLGQKYDWEIKKADIKAAMKETTINGVEILPGDSVLVK